MQVLLIPEVSSSLQYGSLLAFTVCMAFGAVLYRKEPRLVGGFVAVLLLLNVPLMASVYGQDPCAVCAKATGALWWILLCFAC